MHIFLMHALSPCEVPLKVFQFYLNPTQRAVQRILNTLLLQASVLTPLLHTASMPPRRHSAAGSPATSRRQSKVINSLLFTFIVLSCFLYSLCPSFFSQFFSHFFDRYILLQATGNITQVLKSVRPRLHLRLMPLPPPP